MDSDLRGHQPTAASDHDAHDASKSTPVNTSHKHAPQSFETVYRIHYDYVWKTARRLGVPESQAEDVAHDVFLVVARRLAEFRAEAEMRTWLFAIATRVVANLRRAQARRDRREQAYQDCAKIEGRASQSGGYARVDASRLLYSLLDELDDPRRVVFILADLEGCSAPEIASRLDLNVNTVYTRLRSARQRVADALHQRELLDDPTQP